jgi:glycosyltransferase involved in cell wall biosynthesis
MSGPFDARGTGEELGEVKSIPKVDIIVPVFNEEASIDEFYARVERLGYADALIFVDNGSTDGTVERLANCRRAQVILHATNEGWGASVRDGIKASDGEIVVLIDGDLEYPPEAIPNLVEALQHSPVVYCSRFLGPRPPDMPWSRRLGNAVMSGIYNLLFRQRTTDFATGMKGLRRHTVPLERLRRNGFEHGAEIAALIAFAGHRIREIPVEYTPRQRGRSKMRHLREALKVVFFFLVYRIRGTVDGGRQ